MASVLYVDRLSALLGRCTTGWVHIASGQFYRGCYSWNERQMLLRENSIILAHRTNKSAITHTCRRTREEIEYICGVNRSYTRISKGGRGGRGVGRVGFKLRERHGSENDAWIPPSLNEAGGVRNGWMCAPQHSNPAYGRRVEMFTPHARQTLTNSSISVVTCFVMECIFKQIVLLLLTVLQCYLIQM